MNKKASSQAKFHLFSVEYAKQQTIKNNLVLYLMYGVSYPFAYLLNAIRISPNNITTISIVLTFIACYALITGSVMWYLVFWACAVLLDFCDGTVARMSNTVSKSAFRYDHMSDLLKIAAIFLSVAIYFSESFIWILSFCALFFYLYYTLISHDLDNHSKIGSNPESEHKPEGGEGGLKNRIKQNPFLYRIAAQIYSIFATINGHTLLLFFLLPLNANLAALIYIYFLALVVNSMLINGIKLMKLEKV